MTTLASAASASSQKVASTGPSAPAPTSTSTSTKKRKASPPPDRHAERLNSIGADHTDDDAQSSTSRLNREAREAKRTRVHFSCVECHRRKQKCDRKEPCSQCVARRVPQLCRPFLNGQEDPNKYVLICDPADGSVRMFKVDSVQSKACLLGSYPLFPLQQLPQRAPRQISRRYCKEQARICFILDPRPSLKRIERFP
jgi:hypothetical protein